MINELLNFSNVFVISAVVVVALALLGMIVARLYQRASKELSFVRTGFGGQKVIMNGGALVFPVLHDVIPVNMNTLRLEVRRAHQQALITRDRMRVDVTAEFYVRVQPTTESIANAAQTLGLKTTHPDDLKQLVEGKFVDALRAVAAEMAMEELHEKRVDFVQKVQQVVSEDLLKNGLELESVSLTGLDQTSREFFNPDNAFDAEGLTKLTEAIEHRRKQRNEIEQDTNVAIANKNLEAKREQLEINKQVEYAQLEQQRELEIRKAAQSAHIAQEQAQKRREAEQARIVADQEVETSRISAERAIEQERIEKERLLREQEISKSKALELAQQEREIAIADKSKDKSVSEAEASRARAEAVRAEEAVVTVRETEKAERLKAVELVAAAQQAEREAISIKVAAEAEKQASEDQAEALQILANADASKQRVAAQADADAERLRAEAAAVRYSVDAAGQRALNEASNLLSAEQVAMQLKMALIKHLPNIIRESVRPMEQIDGIKIVQVDGLNGSAASRSGNGGSDTAGVSSASLADQVVNSALRYRGQAPLIDSLLQEVGLDAGDINGLSKPVSLSSLNKATLKGDNDGDQLGAGA